MLNQQRPTPEQTSAHIRTVEGPGLIEYQLSDVLQEIRPEGGVRGQAGMLLLYGHAARLEKEILQLRLERNEAQQSLDRYRTLYHEERERSSILRAERDAVKTESRLRQAFITLGGIVTGIGGGAQARTDNGYWWSLLALFGITLLLVGWFLPRSKASRQ